MNFLARFFGSNRTESADSDDVRAKVRAMDDRLHDLERAQKSLELEWGEVYDKVTHLMARVTKRAKTAASPAAQDAATDDNGPPPSADPSPLTGRVLGTHAKMQEMRRRMNGLLPR